MKKSASQVYASLTAKLEASGQVAKLAAVRKYGEALKIAVSKDTEDFCTWALNTRDPVDPHTVEHFISAVVGVETRPPAEAGAKGPRWQKGNLVNIRADKHKGGDVDVYKKFDKKIGTITEVDGLDVLVAFKGEPAPVRFPGANKAMGVGMYSYKEPFNLPNSSHVEIVYRSGNPATTEQQVMAEHYLSKTRAPEKRILQYYTGYVSDASKGGKGYYFRMYSQQRVDPNIEEGGTRPRTFNPSVGEVYYIGVMGKRPKGWKEDLKMLVEELAPPEGGSKPEGGKTASSKGMPYQGRPFKLTPKQAQDLTPPVPEGVDPDKWARVADDVQKSVATLNRIVPFVKYDPDDFYDYAQFKGPKGQFSLGDRDLRDSSAVAILARQWDDVEDLVTQFAAQDAPFRDNLHRSVKSVFGASKAAPLAYTIVTRLVENKGVRWWT